MIGILTRVREHLDTLTVPLFSFVRERRRREAVEQSLSANLSALELGVRDIAVQLRNIGDVVRGLAAICTELDGSAEMQILTGSLIPKAFANALCNASWWMFCGGTGTYMRSVTLPALAESSQKNNGIINLNIQVIDPREDALCASYARQRHTADVWPDSDSPWTQDLVQKAVYATILAACWYSDHYGLLKIKLGLTSSWSNFRYDLTPTCLVITVRDKGYPAYRIQSDKLFYRYWETNLRISFDQTLQVPLDRAFSLGLSPTCDQVRELFAALGLPLGSSYDDNAIQAVINKALCSDGNPYSRD
jgi:hypothetical protein